MSIWTRFCGSGILKWMMPLVLATTLSACKADGESENTNVASAAAVVAANNPPSIGGTPATSVMSGGSYLFQPSASDPEGNTLTFSIANQPNWIDFNASTGALAGTPGNADVGSYSNITISVTDGANIVSLTGFSITVTAAGGGQPTNSAPTISGVPPTTATVGTAYSFQPSAADANGDSLTFSVSGSLPPGLSVNAATGAITGTPTTAGTYANIRIRVTDGSATVSLAAFAITVAAANRTPVISGTPTTTVAAASSYSFTPLGNDADGDALTYAISNKPSWANFSTGTGRLSGTPTASQKGTYPGIVISVSDGRGGSASLAAFTITVTNTAPTITGTPTSSARIGMAYSFVPAAADANGDALAFSISNKPSWATFNTVTGALTGTPSATGTHSNIVITVSDGTSSAALASFTITVSAATGSATLIWAAPTQNTDGSPLTDLAGYAIYYGTSPTNLSSSVSVGSPGATTYTVTGLTTGTTYYFAIAAVNSAGINSNLSAVASKTL